MQTTLTVVPVSPSLRSPAVCGLYRARSCRCLLYFFTCTWRLIAHAVASSALSDSDSACALSCCRASMLEPSITKCWVEQQSSKSKRARCACVQDTNLVSGRALARRVTQLFPARLLPAVQQFGTAAARLAVSIWACFICRCMPVVGVLHQTW